MTKTKKQEFEEKWPYKDCSYSGFAISPNYRSLYKSKIELASLRETVTRLEFSIGPRG